MKIKIMNKNSRTPAGIVALMLLLGVCGAWKAALCDAPQAAEPSPAYAKYMKTAGGVAAEMFLPGYWVGNSQLLDSVLMSPERIRAFNAANKNALTTESGNTTALTDIGDAISGAFVREMAGAVYKPKPSETVYLNGAPVTEKYWADLDRRLHLNAIPKTVSVRFGYAVFWTTLQAYPVRDVVGEKDDLLFDKMVRSNCRPCQPLAVVHESADGGWYYVFTDSYGGWIEKRHVALCKSRKEWLRRMEPEHCLVVTGSELCLDDDPYCEELSGARFPMGTALPLVSPDEAPESVRSRIGFGCYAVKIPLRGGDGWIRDEYAMVPVSADVCVGRLEFTAANVLRQMFKLLGRRYGWGGDGHANDCSGVLRDVFSCFGVVLPRTSARQAEASGAAAVDLSGLTDGAKLDMLKKTRAGSLLFFPGHAMLYLGTVKEKPYVISAVSSFSEDRITVLSVNTVVVNSLTETYRKDGESWLSHLTTLIRFD
ncbi:SH3 domain-containing protein [Pyramidobacter piscolens]|uniref:SH3 domain-containing protein n=1 Tax=Pyramidobacter piscolens TaxID=638849 RepID=UPI0028E9680F|nr:SH3 domain-containing protein [Pyramidobacter piscolens]